MDRLLRYFLGQFHSPRHDDVHGREWDPVYLRRRNHVGIDFYETYFRRCAELLGDDGVMVLHSIGRSTGPDVTSPWITKYIFPGGYIPALSEVRPAIEKAVRLYDERFARMWEFYLAASEMSFRKQNLMNFQIQLARRQGIVPMTQD